MILSDDAKRFAIAREIERAKTMSYLTNGAILPLLIGVGYLISRTVNKMFNLLKGPPRIRLKMYGMVVPIVAYASVFLEDLNSYYLEGILDSRTCMLDISYAKGGVEYYDKQLNSNIAMRALNRVNGKDVYNLHGNPWPSLFRPYKYRFPTLRKQMCKEILQSTTTI
jgi:hypothetical protein